MNAKLCRGSSILVANRALGSLTPAMAGVDIACTYPPSRLLGMLLCLKSSWSWFRSSVSRHELLAVARRRPPKIFRHAEAQSAAHMCKAATARCYSQPCHAGVKDIYQAWGGVLFRSALLVLGSSLLVAAHLWMPTRCRGQTLADRLLT